MYPFDTGKAPRHHCVRPGAAARARDCTRYATALLVALMAAACTYRVRLAPEGAGVAATYFGIVQVERAAGASPGLERLTVLGAQLQSERVTLGYVSEHVVRLDERCRVVFILDSLSDANRVALAEQHRDVCVVEPPFVPPQEVSR